ncbi:UDP-N-acetylmuramate--L-alanine ligase [Capsulimonas corticalis]|uniref:UDP-N-acetylmuramate--L-alanine ligase n=1 Tax=Capsulimonas corticalis TaxID=2219043 RepID=A0A402D386_9BACT|nr:UDP-N-acetylmuramate--L-alanine ligase [Capsulimonas corticalis]BDI28483.1 UDP-N-acetylmuramate--L-alanine ligase [Capsulimonas corticalis]
MSETIHFVGVGGVGMSGLARIVAAQGGAVTGSDARDSETLEALRKEHGIRAVAGHHADNVNGATLVVVSAAVKKDNPEVVAARAQGIPVISRAQMLGRLMDNYKRSIAVTGTHGKTTTTGMIAMVLEQAGLDPTVLIGGDLPAYGGNARLGKSDVFLTEACEAYDSFLELNPRYAVITNIEADHLDYYGDLANVLRSFRRFLTQVSEKAIVCGYDENVRTMLMDRTGLPETMNYGLYEHVNVRATEVTLDGLNPSYAVTYKGERLGVITLSVPGIHNVANSLAAVSVGLELGIAFEDIAVGLANFTGTGRRFERLGETPGGVLVIDDYAHHPTEIRATLAAARHGYPNRRLVAVFQPHLPSRTNDFKEQFAESFRDADHVFLTDIYLAREQPIEGVTGAALAALTADRRGASHVTYVADKAMIPARLGEYTHPGDVVIALGAGHDVRTVAEAFVAQGRESMAVAH